MTNIIRTNYCTHLSIFLYSYTVQRGNLEIFKMILDKFNEYLTFDLRYQDLIG